MLHHTYPCTEYCPCWHRVLSLLAHEYCPCWHRVLSLLAHEYCPCWRTSTVPVGTTHIHAQSTVPVGACMVELFLQGAWQRRRPPRMRQPALAHSHQILACWLFRQPLPLVPAHSCCPCPSQLHRPLIGKRFLARCVQRFGSVQHTCVLGLGQVGVRNAPAGLTQVHAKIWRRSYILSVHIRASRHKSTLAYIKRSHHPCQSELSETLRRDVLLDTCGRASMLLLFLESASVPFQ